MSENLVKKRFSIFPDNSKNSFIDVYFKDDNVWLSQKYMAELFGCSLDNVSLHLKNIFKSGELDEDSVTEESSIVQK